LPDGLLALLLEVAPSAEPILKRVLGSIRKESERDKVAQQLMLALMYEDGHKVREAIEGLVKQNEAFAGELGQAMSIAQEGTKIARSATRQVAVHNKDLRDVLDETRKMHATIEKRLPPLATNR
jgi:flagellar hook-basal body complex protein FliE